MRVHVYLMIIYLLASCGNSEVSDNENQSVEVNEDAYSFLVDSVYDETLATKLEADEYGMYQYYMGLLWKGSNRPTDDTVRDSLQSGHLNNINKMAEEGKLVLAGPFMDNDSLRGIFIFKVKDLNEAQDLVKADPAIAYGSLIMELKPWYGSAALNAIPNLHELIQKTSF